jgi:predicted nucleotidyltransferase
LTRGSRSTALFAHPMLEFRMLDELQAVFRNETRVAYALLFGSAAQGTMHRHSDVDIAVGLAVGARLALADLGELVSKLEGAAGRPVHLVVLDEAPPGLAYRIVRDGRRILVRDQRALNARRARAVLEYLDFRPIEDLCVRGVLAAAHGG